MGPVEQHAASKVQSRKRGKHHASVCGAGAALARQRLGVHGSANLWGVSSPEVLCDRAFKILILKCLCATVQVTNHTGPKNREHHPWAPHLTLPAMAPAMAPGVLPEATFRTVTPSELLSDQHSKRGEQTRGHRRHARAQVRGAP